MRRPLAKPLAKPLDWLVVSISFMVLVANRMYAQPDVVPALAPVPTLASPSVRIATDSPFAYVREDGSQEFLPVVNGGSEDLETAHARQFEGVTLATADPRIAVYTWSSPVAASERPALQ
jgi:hypothetical protein